MSDDYTPITSDVRDAYCEGRWEGFPDTLSQNIGSKFGGEFDRWLAEHDRQVADDVLVWIETRYFGGSPQSMQWLHKLAREHFAPPITESEAVR